MSSVVYTVYTSVHRVEWICNLSCLCMAVVSLILEMTWGNLGVITTLPTTSIRMIIKYIYEWE